MAMRREGVAANHKRVYRLYREEGHLGRAAVGHPAEADQRGVADGLGNVIINPSTGPVGACHPENLHSKKGMINES